MAVRFNDANLHAVRLQPNLIGQARNTQRQKYRSNLFAPIKRREQVERRQSGIPMQPAQAWIEVQRDGISRFGALGE